MKAKGFNCNDQCPGIVYFHSNVLLQEQMAEKQVLPNYFVLGNDQLNIHYLRCILLK